MFKQLISSETLHQLKLFHMGISHPYLQANNTATESYLVLDINLDIVCDSRVEFKKIFSKHQQLSQACLYGLMVKFLTSWKLKES